MRDYVGIVPYAEIVENSIALSVFFLCFEKIF